MFCHFLSPAVVSVRDPVHLSPLEPSAAPADTEQQSTENGNSLSNDLQPPYVSTETSNVRPQAPKTEDVLEEEDEAGGALTISELAYRSIVKSISALLSTVLQSYCVGSLNILITLL